jgi:hypothetical protein
MFFIIIDCDLARCFHVRPPTSSRVLETAAKKRAGFLALEVS